MSKRQVAMVFDLNKCLGCHTCTMACKTLWTRDEGQDYMWWNSVNTMPGKGTPRGWEDMGGGFENGEAKPGQMPTRRQFGEAWEFNHKDIFEGGQGKQTHLQVRDGEPDWGPNWDEEQGAGEYPNSYFFYLPRICNHCSEPACVAACPRKAIEKREEDGIVVINEDHCRGLRFCMEACPYKKIYFNDVIAKSQKCILCYPRLEQGVAPACARQCPGRLRHVGYLDDENSSVHKLVRQWKVAVPLHPEYGTQPNVFYVPPTNPKKLAADGRLDHSEPRIPQAYLHSLFGQAGLDALAILEDERQKVRDGGKSELIDLLVVYKWSDMLGGFDQDPATIRWTDAG